ncbi:MAG: hypothetical protein ACR2HJ_11155 [Fimbriimonadales bacterium]
MKNAARPKLPVWLIALVLAALALFILLLVNFVAVRSKPDDEAQIRAAIEEMRVASLENKPGGVQKYLSESFELPEGVASGDGMFDNPKARVATFIRRANFSELTISDVKIQVAGGAAIATVHASGSLSYPPLPTDFSFDFPEMQIEFKREMRNRLLLISDPTWSVVRVFGVRLEDIGQ